MISDTIISIVIPVHNDADIIVERLSELKKNLGKTYINFEILIVDNNSSDETQTKITTNRKIMNHVRIIVLAKDYDREIALTAGLDNCVGDYAILFNLHVDPAEEIPNILKRLIKEKQDILIGKPRRELIKHDLLSKMFLGLVHKFSSQGFIYQQNYFIGLNRKAINSIVRTRRKSRDFSYISSLIGLRHDYFKYWPVTDYKYKLPQQNFLHVCLSTIDTIISHSYRPMRLLSFTGMLLSIFYLVWIILVVILAVFFNFKHIVPQGWISISTVISVLFFLMFSLLTLISEYLIRVLDETRNEPFYFISEEISKSTIIPRKKTLNIV